MTFKRLQLVFSAILLALAANSPAAGQDDFQRLRLGVSLSPDEAIRERIEPFRLYLEEKLDVPVDLFLIDTLGQLAEALANGDIDYARLSSSSYAAVYSECECIEPLATVRPDGFPARFYSVLIAKTAKPRKTIADLKGGRLGVGDHLSIASYRVPLSNLLAEGIDPRKHFRTMVQVKGEIEGLQAVLDGRIEASLGWSSLAGAPNTGYTAGSLNDFFLRGAAGFDKLQIVWRSQPIPYNAHAVRSGLPDHTKRQLRGALLDLLEADPLAYFSREPDFPGGLEPVVHADYRAVLRSYEPDFQTVFVKE
ncbi:phosphate/phosphite/phosphonate ABC transporter substrate-binding protein [Roseibium algae]|uniref:Phosphate/phosphite/phosphonate ABC transporter substrate-binding protein n=1 Tax=Roseibium algae TaxID=3123038 RepID=A0ABU8TR61_9HYPH